MEMKVGLKPSFLQSCPTLTIRSHIILGGVADSDFISARLPRLIYTVFSTIWIRNSKKFDRGKRDRNLTDPDEKLL